MIANSNQPAYALPYNGNLGDGRTEGAAARERDDLNQFGARQLVNMVQRHLHLVLGIIGIVMAAALLAVVMATPLYETTAVLQVNAPVGDDGTPVAMSAAEAEARIETATSTLASHGFARQVVTDLDLLRNPHFVKHPLAPGEEVGRRRLDGAANKLLGLVKVDRVSNAQLITVSVTSPSPKLSAMIANRYVTVRQGRERAALVARQQGMLHRLARQTVGTRQDLHNAEEAVAQFRLAHRMLPGAGGEADLGQINQIAAEAISASGARAESAARSAGVSAAARLRATTDGASSPLLSQQQQQYAQLLQRKAELSTFYGPGHPELANVNAQIDEVKRNMEVEQGRVRRLANVDAAAAAARETQLARSDASGAAARESQLRSYLGDLTAKAYRNNEANVELAELERRAGTARELYVGLALRLKSMAAAAAPVSDLSLQSAAQVPGAPISPAPRKTMVVAFLGSSVLALVIAFMAEMMDHKLRNSDQIRRHFGLPTFAMIPLVQDELVDPAETSPVVSNPRSLFAETARTLYMEVAQRHGGPGAQMVVVTSPLPGDGKSTVALSLSAAAAAAGRRSIVVDLDLRRATVLQDVQRRTGGPDLLEYFRDGGALPPMLPADNGAGEEGQEDGPHQLAVLSAHQPVADPGSLITASRLEQLFRDLRERFDFIVLNAPPVLAVRDARTLSDMADSTLLVVRWGHTTIEEGAAALELLGKPASGVVFNRVDYAEHARRGYGDAVQFYQRAAAYYEDAGTARGNRRLDALLRKLGLRSAAA